MARLAAILVFALVVATACSDDKNPVREYGNTLTGAVKKAEHAKAVSDLVTIKAEIMRFKSEQGDYPPNLQALKMNDIRPDLYSYDPDTGTVALEQ